MTVNKRYGVFIVKVWREPIEVGEGPWRASTLNTATRERSYFTTPEDLVAFLHPWPVDEETLMGLGYKPET